MIDCLLQLGGGGVQRRHDLSRAERLRLNAALRLEATHDRLEHLALGMLTE
jgi:hypothetical protein